MEGGLGTPASSAGSSTCKRLQQHLGSGYLRTELPRLQSTLAEEEGRTACLANGASGCYAMNRQNGHSDVINTSLRLPVPPAASCSSVCPLETYSSETYKPSLSYQNNHLISFSHIPPFLSSSHTPPFLSFSPTHFILPSPPLLSSPPLLLSSPTPPLLSSLHPLSQEEGCCVTKCSSSNPQARTPSPQSDFRLTPGSIPLQPCLLSPNPWSSSATSATQLYPPNPRPRSPNPNSRTCPSGSTGSRSPQSPQPTCPSRSPPSGDTPFSSSFSFIQQSLNLYSLSSSHRTDTDTAAGERPPGLNPDPQPLNSSNSLGPDPQPLNSSISLGPDPLDQSSARSLRTGSVQSHSEPLEMSGSIPPCQSKPVSASLDQLPSRTSDSSSNQSLLGVLGLSLGFSVSKLSTQSCVQSEPDSIHLSQSDRGRDRLSPWVWQDRHWEGREEAGPSRGSSDLAELEPDCDSSSLDTEAATSSLSVGEDSDAASASSLTSGYESATPTTAIPGPAHDCIPDQGWDQLVQKYEGVLQDCLHNNRTNTKIQCMMLKLRRLQQKAILEDEYDSAERFGKKLEELCRERSSLRLGLPSRQPCVALFLQRLRDAVHSAFTRMEDHGEEVETTGGEGAETIQGPLQRRERLLQEKRMVEEEMAELQWRLGELQSRSCSLEHQIQQEEEELQTEEVEGPALRSCTHTQLRDMGHALDDLVTSQNRTRITVSPPEAILRLQQQEQTLSLSIKDATAKVVMSQRLGGSLRRKVSETETQLLALHEAKLAAISGNDFSSAKELKAEIRAVYRERDRLELLVKRLHSLSFGNSQDLAKMKTQQQQLKQELETRQAQHEQTLKENVVKYIELLEDRLQRCGRPPLERIWEADLEACHLLLRGLQLRTPFCSGPDPATVVLPSPQPATKQEADLEECAMLTALGGRWCPEANLQNSEFTKKLEEFLLFCMEDVHPEEEDSGSEAEELTADLTIELTDQCEEISNRLLILEDDFQTAIQNRDQALTQSLEQEVREVKATLHTMLTQLNEEVEEEEEDQYFSDSWEI